MQSRFDFLGRHRVGGNYPGDSGLTAWKDRHLLNIDSYIGCYTESVVFYLVYLVAKISGCKL